MQISIYDKTNNLTDFVEFRGDGEINCYYKIEGNVMNRKFYNEIDNEIVSSTIEYKSPVMLHPIPWQIETSYTAIESGGTLSSYGKIHIVERIDTYQDKEVNSLSQSLFTINQNFINDCLNKL